MLSHKNAHSLAPFPVMSHRLDTAPAQPKHLPPARPIIPQTLSDSPRIPRPPPKPHPPRFVLKSSDSVPIDPQSPAPLKTNPYRNSYLDPIDSPLRFQSVPPKKATNDLKNLQSKPVYNLSKQIDYSLEVRSTKPTVSKHSSPPILEPHPAAKLPIQELDASPYSVKKRFKIGKQKRSYNPTHSPVLGRGPAVEASLTSYSRSPEDTPNHFTQSLSDAKIKKRDRPAPKSVQDSKAFSSLPLQDVDSPVTIVPSLLKSHSQREDIKEGDGAVCRGMHTSPSFDSSDPSVADISSLKLVARFYSQFQAPPTAPRPQQAPTPAHISDKTRGDQLLTRSERADTLVPRADSFMDDFVLIDAPSRAPPEESSSSSELELLKRRLRKVYSTEDIVESADQLTSSSSTSVFVQDFSSSIACTPSVATPKRGAWDLVNSAFSFGKHRAPPTPSKLSDPASSSPPSISGSEEDDDQGGKILLRSKRPAHEIFRESVRVKKRERIMIASMTKDKEQKDLRDTSVSSVSHEPEESEQKMFEYVIVVGLTKSRAGDQYEPSISYRFPPMNDQSTSSFLASVPQFCFPDASLWKPAALKPSHNHLSETYSFVLTDELGMKKFGYCRRILPKGKDLPEVYCIISPLGCFSLYSAVLDHVETERGRPSALVYAFLRSIISRPLPLPGQAISIKSIFTDSREGQGDLKLYRPQESSRLEHVNFSKLICCLGIRLTLQLFAATLLERRIIFVAEQLSLLSSCCHAIVALLYPFSWQHVFVPILPEAMVHICCSPSPYIVGLLPSSIETVLQFGEEMEEAVIFSLDERRFIRKAGDEEHLLPSKLQTALESLLTGCDQPDTWRENPEMSDVVIEAFIRFFIEILDIYKDFTYPNLEDPTIIEFQTKAFLKTIKSKASRRFLSEFCKTQMFFNFLQEQGDNPEFSQSIKTMFQERYDEIMSNRVLSSKYGKQCSSGLLKKLRIGKITSYTPGKSK